MDDRSDSHDDGMTVPPTVRTGVSARVSQPVCDEAPSGAPVPSALPATVPSAPPHPEDPGVPYVADVAVPISVRSVEHPMHEAGVQTQPQGFVASEARGTPGTAIPFSPTPISPDAPRGPSAVLGQRAGSEPTLSEHRPAPGFASVFAASPLTLSATSGPSARTGVYPASAAYVPPLSAAPAVTPPAYWPGLSDGRADERLTERAAGWGGFFAKAAKYVAIGVVMWFAVVFLLILVYRFVDPPMSALMLQRKLMGESVMQTWVPIEGMSPRVVRAVIVSEDGRFCQHWGVDVEAIEVAIAKSGDGTPRGASTISMQVAKNLFLWPSKSYVRKLMEVPLTMAIEMLWSKKRILEVYLNIAEWGPGIFGVEEAARHHFRKPALRLNDRESARLAVSLPNPIRRDAGHPGPGTRRLAALNMARSRGSASTLTGCVLGPNASD